MAISSSTRMDTENQRGRVNNSAADACKNYNLCNRTHAHVRTYMSSVNELHGMPSAALTILSRVPCLLLLL